MSQINNVPILIREMLPGMTERYALRNLTPDDVLLISLALAPKQEEVARRLEDLRDPTIRTLIELQGKDPKHDMQTIMDRLSIIRQTLTGSPKSESL